MASVPTCVAPTAQAPPGPDATPCKEERLSGLGLGTARHRVPSHRSVSVRYCTVTSSTVEPTAHAPVASAATLDKALTGLGPFGLGTTFHAAPSQCSVRVRPSMLPTAHTSVGDAAASATSSLSLPA